MTEEVKSRPIFRKFFNDGFCDICCVFEGHEEVMPCRSLDGHHFHTCENCKSKLMALSPSQQKKMVEDALGKRPIV